MRAASYGLAQAFNMLDMDGYLDGRMRASYPCAISLIQKVDELRFSHVKITLVHRDLTIPVNEYRNCVQLMPDQQVNVAGTQEWLWRAGVWKLVHIASSIKPVRP